MKEAAGEANVTVITIVLIGIVASAGAVLIPRILTSVKVKSCCTENGGYISGNLCKQWQGNEDNDVALSLLKNNYEMVCK